MDSRTTKVSDITERLQSEFGPGSGSAQHHQWLVESGPEGAACMLTLRLMELAQQPEIVITGASRSGHLTQIYMPIASLGHLAAILDSVRQWTGTVRRPGRSPGPPDQDVLNKSPGRDAEVRGPFRGPDSEPPDGGADPPEIPGRHDARSPPHRAPDRLHFSRDAE